MTPSAKPGRLRGPAAIAWASMSGHAAGPGERDPGWPTVNQASISAPPLLLLHALGENSADWDQVAATLTDSWHVYALDLRGHGSSDWPGTNTLALLRDDVLAFLDAQKLPHVTVIGHSMERGGRRTLVASGSPSEVRRLVLEELRLPGHAYRRPRSAARAALLRLGRDRTEHRGERPPGLLARRPGRDHRAGAGHRGRAGQPRQPGPARGHGRAHPRRPADHDSRRAPGARGAARQVQPRPWPFLSPAPPEARRIRSA